MYPYEFLHDFSLELDHGLFCPFGSRDWSMFIDNGNLSSIGLRTELRNWSMILTTGFVDDIEAANHLIIVP